MFFFSYILFKSFNRTKKGSFSKVDFVHQRHLNLIRVSQKQVRYAMTVIFKKLEVKHCP